MSEEKVLYLLQKKKGFFEAILDLTETEEHLPLHEWVPVLEQKQVLLSCVDEIDEQLAPFQATMHSISQEVDEEIDKTRDIVKRILDLNVHIRDKRKRDIGS